MQYEVAARQQVRRLIINWKRRINYMTYHKYESHSHAQTHGSGKSSEFAGQRHTSVIAADQREHMIAEAAYYLAEHYNREPSTVPLIEEFKKLMAK